MIEYFNKFRIVNVKLIFIVSLLFIITGMVMGCSNNQFSQPNVGSSHNPIKKEEPGVSFFGEELMPITEVEGSFSEVAGWLTDDTILYITNLHKGSNLYTYHLSSGVSSLFYQSDVPVVSADISPLRDKVFIHAAPTSYQAEVIVVDINGETLSQAKIDSFELAYEWNFENEEEVLLSAFNEDWSFNTYVLNIPKSSLTEVPLPEPFIVWPKAKEMLYLKWDENGLNLNAPLIKRNLENKKEATLMNSVHHIDSSKEYILAISTSEQDSKESIYSIMNTDFEKISEFEVYHLTAFSSWLVPFYDFIDREEKIIYLHPVRSGEADLYDEGFVLTEYSFETKKGKQLLNDLENEPISCSPNGTLCLYGYQFEKLIDLKEKEIINLVEQ
ncbi:hypothetical protein [Mesobacillus maritimus]|uniref:YqgU-like 6-bladed beta-propeller domain-containing protein n=1 Tax=Mesobacillus maritimus TaxID=1643336 RepID=A0ABS7K298_9BACI|nr:hypothetical protein [Mesobacillus maritimus]MBY0096382.1 hypothetical protein [Mesobacillus maritimus]